MGLLTDSIEATLPSQILGLPVSSCSIAQLNWDSCVTIHSYFTAAVAKQLRYKVIIECLGSFLTLLYPFSLVTHAPYPYIVDLAHTLYNEEKLDLPVSKATI